MSIEKERVQPTHFETVKPAQKPTEARDSPDRGPSRWTFPALGGLVVLAVAVVFWLPSALENAAEGMQQGMQRDLPGEDAPNAGANTPAQPGAAPRTTEAGTPFADAEAARLRGEAQEILNTLLDLRDSLTRRGAGIWAKEDLAAVIDTANAGDERYRQREFTAAIERYQAALAQAEAIEARIPDELEKRLAATEAALQAGKAEAAGEALSVIDDLEPDLAQADSLRERLEALPEVLAQLEKATAAERQGDLETAKSALQAAVAADGEHRRAAQGLSRVSAALTEQRFADAMSAGYAALESQRFDQARTAFQRAGALRTDSNEVAAAIEEVRVAETASELRQLQRKAEASIAEENWTQAVEAFEAALKIESSVLFAQRGIEQARTRAELDKRLRAVLDEPDRLSDTSVADNTAQLLDYALDVEPRGPVLKEQIRTLQKQLALANTPIAVTVLSDNTTDVVVLKVSRLGQFEREELMLRPGEYTAVGTRRGYRDVRRTFRVSHDERPPTVTVVCTESI
ncbi:MAG: hypothetical protein ABR612_05145 [Chromatocurvus sp.]